MSCCQDVKALRERSRAGILDRVALWASVRVSAGTCPVVRNYVEASVSKQDHAQPGSILAMPCLILDLDHLEKGRSGELHAEAWPKPPGLQESSDRVRRRHGQGSADIPPGLFYVMIGRFLMS